MEISLGAADSVVCVRRISATSVFIVSRGVTVVAFTQNNSSQFRKRTCEVRSSLGLMYLVNLHDLFRILILFARG